MSLRLCGYVTYSSMYSRFVEFRSKCVFLVFSQASIVGACDVADFTDFA